MTRIARSTRTLDLVTWLLASLLLGALIGSIAKHAGAPIELRVAGFVALTGITLAIWRIGRHAPEAAA